jgi:hypothetical protein
LGTEGGRPGRPTQAVRHTCSGNLGIFKIFKIAPHKQKSIVKIWQKDALLTNGAQCTIVNPALAKS